VGDEEWRSTKGGQVWAESNEENGERLGGKWWVMKGGYFESCHDALTYRRPKPPFCWPRAPLKRDQRSHAVAQRHSHSCQLVRAADGAQPTHHITK